MERGWNDVQWEKKMADPMTVKVVAVTSGRHTHQVTARKVGVESRPEIRLSITRELMDCINKGARLVVTMRGGRVTACSRAT